MPNAFRNRSGGNNSRASLWRRFGVPVGVPTNTIRSSPYRVHGHGFYSGENLYRQQQQQQGANTPNLNGALTNPHHNYHQCDHNPGNSLQHHGPSHQLSPIYPPGPGPGAYYPQDGQRNGRQLAPARRRCNPQQQSLLPTRRSAPNFPHTSGDPRQIRRQLHPGRMPDFVDDEIDYPRGRLPARYLDSGLFGNDLDIDDDFFLDGFPYDMDYGRGRRSLSRSSNHSSDGSILDGWDAGGQLGPSPWDDTRSYVRRRPNSAWWCAS